MKKTLLLISLLAAAISSSALAQKKIYPDRWAYVTTGLAGDRDVESFREIARTSSEHGLTAILLSAGLDQADLQPPEYFARLKRVKEICDGYHLELIPSGFSAGYGGATLSHDRNLAAGMPVKGALFVARKDEARFQSDSPVQLANGGFEQADGDRLAGFPVQDRSGELTFVDRGVFKEGKSSVRFENFASAKGGEARVAQEIRVTPYREYRVRCWVKTEGAAPLTLFSISAHTPEKRNLSWFEPELAATADWKEYTAGFNSWNADKLLLSIGVSEGTAGKLWLDGLRIEEVGLTNVVRRPGTPLEVRNEKTGMVYEEGRDFAPIADPRLSSRFDHEGPAVKLLPGSRIKAGDRLRADYYHSVSIYRGQVPICMSEPKVYEIWAKQIAPIEKHLAPKRYFLNMDEMRVGGFCEACKNRKMSMAQILGDCVTRQHKMIRAVNPKAEIFVWSDMFDPNHNARPNYYLVDGDYTGSWNYVPKDMVMVCWWLEKARARLDHFSRLGFKTFAGAYYDADDIENPKGWLEELDKTPGALGIMYTTWQNKFKLLAPFGDLVSKR